MWVKAFRYFGWKKFQCGTRRCLCRVFLPLAPAPQSGRLPPRPVNGRFAGLLLMRLQPMQTPGLGEIMSMKRGIVRGNGFPLLDKSQQQAEMFIFQARTFAPETLAACPSRGLRAGGPRCPCPRRGAGGLAFSP